METLDFKIVPNDYVNESNLVDFLLLFPYFSEETITESIVKQYMRQCSIPFFLNLETMEVFKEHIHGTRRIDGCVLLELTDISNIRKLLEETFIVLG